jgi:hypothetical protein
MPKVRFINVGRDSKSWEAHCDGEVTYDFLIGEVRRNQALASSFVDFYEDGAIRVGGRTVGRFEVDQEEGAIA